MKSDRIISREEWWFRRVPFESLKHAPPENWEQKCRDLEHYYSGSGSDKDGAEKIVRLTRWLLKMETEDP